MEESVLRALQACEILYVVHDKDIHRLVEIEEVGYAVGVARVLELQLKGVGRYIEYTRMGVRQQGLVADGVGEVGLPYSAAAVDKERIEGGVARLASRRHAGSACQLIGLACYKVLEGVALIELGIEIVDRFSGLIVGFGSVLFAQRLNRGSRGGNGAPRAGSGVDKHTILQLRAMTEDAEDSRRQEFDIVLLYIFCDKLRLHLQDQGVIGIV